MTDRHQLRDDIHTRMSSTDILGSGTSINFTSKLLFSANQTLISTRGYQLTLPNKASSDIDIWKIKPPDFSPKLYQSLNLPRISTKTLNPGKCKSDWAEISQRIDRMSQVKSSKPEQNKSPFTTSHRAPGTLELKLQSVKSGKLLNIPYKNPKPHNFRPGAENLPDMVTSIEKDPGNLNLKTKFLGHDITSVTGIRSEPNPFQRETLQRQSTLKTAEPKWDASLILPRSPWPPKSASYTRHRRRRGVYSAFMDRVEEKLSSTCIKQQ